MATYNITSNRTTASVGHQSMRGTGVRVPYMVEKVIDFARFNSDAGTANGDVLQVIDIPAGTIVLEAGLQVLTDLTEGGSTTYALQTGATANKWVTAATDPGTLSYFTGILDLEGMKTGFFSSADTIDIVTGTSTTTAGRMRAFAVMLDVSPVMTTEHNPDSYYDTAV